MTKNNPVIRQKRRIPDGKVTGLCEWDIREFGHLQVTARTELRIGDNRFPEISRVIHNLSLLRVYGYNNNSKIVLQNRAGVFDIKKLF
jgi:hypothetical protein